MVHHRETRHSSIPLVMSCTAVTVRRTSARTRVRIMLHRTCLRTITWLTIVLYSYQGQGRPGSLYDDHWEMVRQENNHCHQCGRGGCTQMRDEELEEVYVRTHSLANFTTAYTPVNTQGTPVEPRLSTQLLASQGLSESSAG